MIRLGGVAAWLLALMMPGLMNAASSRGLAVSPAFQAVTIGKDQQQAEHVVQLQNYTAVAQEIRLSVVDFGSLDESGGVAFLGKPAQELERKHGLASWMKLEKEAVVVPPQGVVAVKVVIENRPTLAPGGHYGAVLATATTEGTVKESRVGLKQVLSSLILATKEGGAVPELKLVSQTGNGNWRRLPTSLEHRFQNTGGVHAVPRGIAEVRDPAGKLVARGALNEGSGAVLPGSFRRYQTKLTALDQGWLPGRYEVKTTYRYDGTDKTETLVGHVWYVGSAVVWGVMALVFLSLAGGLWWWLRRRKK